MAIFGKAAAENIPAKYVYSHCPECGVDLATQDRQGHVITHWGSEPIQFWRNPLAQERAYQVLEVQT